jgi:serine/threonine-protein kinase
MSAAVFRSFYRYPQEQEWVGQMQVVRKLAEGGQGHLYEATWEGRTFVLKFFPPDARVESCGHLELALLREVRHPHVVNLLGYLRWPDPEKGLLCLVLERIEGQTLAQHVRERNPHSLEISQRLLDLTGTLVDLHSQGIVHGDLKPDNIVLRAGVEPVLVDFGSGYMPGLTRLPVHERPATTAFCSPEIWRWLAAQELEGECRKPTPTDDVWALGCIFYWLLTNRLPFGLAPQMEVILAILHEVPKAPHECNPRVPVELSALCMRMLEKNLEARCSRATEVREALAGLVASARSQPAWQVPLDSPNAPEALPTEQIPAYELKGYEAELRRLRLARQPQPRRGQPLLPAGPELPLPPQAPYLPWSLAPDSGEVQAPPALTPGAPAPVASALPPPSMPPPPPVPPVPQPSSVRLHLVPPVAAAPPHSPLRRWVSAVLPSCVGMLPVRAMVLDALCARLPLMLLLLVLLAGATLLPRLLRAAPAPVPPQVASLPPPPPALVHKVAPPVRVVEGGTSAEHHTAPSSAPTLAAMKPSTQEKPSPRPHSPVPNRASPLPAGTKAALTAFHVATCVGCAPTTATTFAMPPKPPNEECPAGYQQSHKELEIPRECDAYLGTEADRYLGGRVATSPGAITLKLHHKCGLLPKGTDLHGKLVIGPQSAYLDIRSVQSAGREAPLCLGATSPWESAREGTVNVKRTWNLRPQAQFRR